MHNTAARLYIKLEKLFLEKAEDSFFHAIRAPAWERFKKIGLPVCRRDMFQYFPLHRMYSSLCKTDKEITSKSYTSELQVATISLINGQSTNIQALDKIVALPIEEAMRTYRSIIIGKCIDNIAKENNPFIILNQSLAHGLFVYIPPNTVIDSPITIANCIRNSSASFPFILVFVGAGSKITLSMDNQFTSCSNNFLVNSHLQIHIAQGASVSYYHTHMPQSSRSWTMHSIRAFLQRDSYFSSISLCNGEQTHSEDIAVTLEGENAQTEIRGLWALHKNHQAHIKVLVSHMAPHTRSYQHFKGVNCEQSQSSFEGKIYVHPEAQRTEAYQLSHQLLISDNAIANAKPNLEVFADDVKASHGATISKLSSEELFYLQTRGIPHVDAVSCLLQGYYREILQLISMPVIRVLGDNLAQQCISNI